MRQILSTILHIYACNAESQWCTMHRVEMPRGVTQQTCMMTAQEDFPRWETQFHKGLVGWTIKRWSCASEVQVAWSYTGQ
ncbi:hypothetical protein A2765_03035 [Candidatus Kaiserbacteria bacterium RIFCSPHIGHO2_01_FULL_56_24]|uniref:Uncharacterized protein n=1 Tax=Candidatus Kaiserbacteria bacterium RIFCSPHIGHO2_01_FULL_56_24 TaxID=1798487 RepID=A0A1F6DG44_9BACT|nr:MAG: hypothetical protein A2765_03035 [Candidatus Kaiserbacteria bacterium RIFCSPHIGHO2_01_FULL_56_24]